MKFGFSIPNFGEYADVSAMAEAGRIAEDMGWDGFFVWDHVYFEGIEPVADPWILMTSIAMRTETIRIGPMVTPLVRRRPEKLAREVATLDQLSKGRLILGIGAGWQHSPEATGFGDPGDLRQRAEIVDETLSILIQFFKGGLVNFQGLHRTASIEAFAETHQKPHPPIWVASTWPHRRPQRRAARWDGVFPLSATTSESGILTLEEFMGLVSYIRTVRPDTTNFDFVHAGRNGRGNPAEVETFREAGATWWIEGLRPRSTLMELRDKLREGPPQT
jgi:alkanesulfonate monooxygenase SsuD/methylene tetrahydromethanopterin reductase-like flavin-dependent oxidoreductase (luciferase family)